MVVDGKLIRGLLEVLVRHITQYGRCRWERANVERGERGTDTLKLYTKAHGTKTNNLIINMEDEGDELIFGDDGRTLEGYGCGEFPSLH